MPVAPNEPPVFDESPSTSRNVAENTSAGTNIGASVTATDPEDNTLTYSLDLSSRATFDIVATTGQLRTSAALNFEGKSSYTVTVTATDPSGADDTITVTINVGNVDEEGTVTLGSTQPIVGTSLTASLDDPDEVSGIVTWSWESSQNGNSWILISGATAATYTPDAVAEGRFLRATASYTDEEGSGKSAQAVSTNRVLPVPVAPNTQPVFDEGPSTSRNVAENTAPRVNFGAPVAATDPENDTLTYSLDVTSRATFGIDASSGQLQTKGALDYETAPSYTVTVTAADPAGADDTITVTINVINVNEAGTVTLSSLQPIEGTLLTATLDDPDNVGSGSVTWSWRSSPNSTSSGTLISGETSATYTPVAADVNRFLRAIASYTDGAGPSKSAEAVSANAVQAAPVQPNSPPYFPPSENRARDVHENTPVGTDFGAPVAASDDDDDDTLTYSLGGTNRASFAIDESSGQLRTRAPLNFEVKSSYSVIVTATDPAGASHGIIVNITVGNVEEPGTVTLSSTQPIVGTPLTATLDDPDNVSGSVTWLWERSQNGTSSWTLISGETSATYTPVTADETRFLRATTSYTDGEGSGKRAQAVSTNRVGLAPVAPNEPPVFSSNTAARDVDENTARGVNIGEPVTATDPNNDTLTYSLDVPSRATFNMVATTGQLQTKADLDFETTATYGVTVTATDTAGATGTITVTITVNNDDEPGTVTLSSLQPQVIFQLTATLDDPDDVRGSVTWSWERSPNRSSSWTLISGKTSATYTPVAADVNHYLRATASYDDGAGPGKRAEGVSANVVQPAPVTPNEPPAFVESPPATRNVDENTVAGRDIGLPVTATDPNNDTLTYSLDSSTDAGHSFSIDAASGQLQTKAPLDFEDKSSYIVTVTATDPAGLYDTVTVTITVNNVDEPGTVTLSSLQPQVGFQLTATLDDPDNVSGSVTWSWAGSPNRQLLLDPHQWGNLSHLHAGCRRCNPLPAGHRLLHRWRRVGQERPSGLDQ